jgi:2-amino-4-hydroxy-6-hydroxymethyldihydropteridine diphosphokinase
VAEVFLALGSNVDAERRLQQAARLLRDAFPDVRFSACYRNPAVGFEGDDFINAAALFPAADAIPELLARLHGIEERCGRRREDAKWAPRAMDLDVLLFGGLVGEWPGLKLPRPDLLRRAYMLGPAAELSPQFRHPVAGQTLAELWAALAPTAPPLTRIALDLNDHTGERH